jgi:hypothetical protein
LHPGGSIAQLTSLKGLLLLLLLLMLLLLPPFPRMHKWEVYMYTTADRKYASEAWRLLNPTTSVLPHPLYH